MTWRNEVLVVCNGPRVIAMTTRVFREFDTLGARIRAPLERYMLAHSENRRLPPWQINTEGRHSVNDLGDEVLVLAFKSDTVRLYGADLCIEGEHAFICSAIDLSKKRDKANQALLDAAARNLAPFWNRETKP